LVLAVAHEIGPRAVGYGERRLGDGTLAMNLFEESAAAVSEALMRKSKDASPVRDLSAYLYRTFLSESEPCQNQAIAAREVPNEQDAVLRPPAAPGGTFPASSRRLFVEKRLQPS
jgi:hypothetical protein